MTVSTHIHIRESACPDDRDVAQASAAKSSRFIDNVAHEFRTPLTVIGEYSSLLEEGLLGDLNGEQSEFISIIGDRADDLAHMVDDLIDSTRIDADAVSLVPRRTPVPEIAEPIRVAIERKASVRKIELTIDCPAAIPDVYCDAQKASRILYNLVVNGIKYTDQGGRITVQMQHRRDSHFVDIEVSDTGKGFRPEDVKRIAERFGNVTGRPEERTKGFGLGLNIASELVDRFFGEMRIRSTAGEGSTFTFTLPVARLESVAFAYAARVVRLHGNACGVSRLKLTSGRDVSDTEAGQLQTLIESIAPPDAVVWRIRAGEWTLLAQSRGLDVDDLRRRLEDAVDSANEETGPQFQLPTLTLTDL